MVFGSGLLLVMVDSLGVVYTTLLRMETSAFTAITDDGVTGIKTGPVIIRTRDLKESFT